MNITDFKNEELLLIYYRFSSYLEKLDKNFEQKRISVSIETPMGQGTAFKQLSDEEISQFKLSPTYELSTKIVTKLKPIVEIIEDSVEYSTYADKLK